jgi:hypothetical protein
LAKGSLRAIAAEAGKRSVVALLGSLPNMADFFVEGLRNLHWPHEVFGPAGKRQSRPDSSWPGRTEEANPSPFLPRRGGMV